jgi:hypothetical protein
MQMNGKTTIAYFPHPLGRVEQNIFRGGDFGADLISR